MAETRLSRRQREEIDYLSNQVGEWVSERPFRPTSEEIEEFVAVTAFGAKGQVRSGLFINGRNRLLDAKRMLDISVKQWERDWCILVFPTDFEQDAGESDLHPYLRRILRTIATRRMAVAVLLRAIMQKYPDRFSLNGWKG